MAGSSVEGAGPGSEGGGSFPGDASFFTPSKTFDAANPAAANGSADISTILQQ
jgi:hypothetical protein